MPKLQRILRLNACEGVLLCAALLVVAVVRLALWVLPFRLVRRGVTRITKLQARHVRWATPQMVAWAVRVVSRYVPRATCLTQAISTQVILAALGVSVTLRIGVAYGPGKRLEAHAWVEYQDRILIGWQTRQRFVAFPPIEGAMQ